MKKRDNLPGQLGFDGEYLAKPDAACAANAQPLSPPERKPLPKVLRKFRQFNLKKVLTSRGWETIAFPDGEFRESEE